MKIYAFIIAIASLAILILELVSGDLTGQE